MHPILRATPAALCALLLAACSSAPVEDPIVRTVSASERAAMAPGDVLDALKAGNLRFVTGDVRRRDWKADIEGTAGGAAPIAAILTTCDSRVVLPRALDQGLGDLVVVRTVACAPTDPALEALEDAVERQGVKQVVVLVHGGCDDCGPDHLPSVATGLYERAATGVGDAVAEIEELDDEDVRQIGYARGVLADVLQRSEVLRRAVESGAVGAAIGHYDLGTGAILWL